MNKNYESLLINKIIDKLPEDIVKEISKFCIIKKYDKSKIIKYKVLSFIIIFYYIFIHNYSKFVYHKNNLFNILLYIGYIIFHYNILFNLLIFIYYF